MHYLGIDWAKDKHDLCLLADDGRILSQLVITHDLEGFHKLHELLDKLPDVQINIESSEGLLIDWLAQQPWQLYITPTTTLASRRPTRVKDDKGDAYLLAHLLRLGEPDCRPYTQQSHLVVQLRQLVRSYDRALKEQRRFGNQLTQTLRLYYPVALKLFSRPYYLINLAFLEQFPDPEQAHHLTRDEVEQFLRSQHYNNMDRLDEIYQQLQVVQPRATIYAGHIDFVNMLIPVLRMLHHRKYKLQQQIPRLFDQHPDATWWRSFPGLNGALTPARLLAWIGDDRTRFEDAKALRAYAGTVPVTRRSGKQTYVEFRRHCQKALRSAVDDFAMQSMKHSGWARAYVTEQLARGHQKPRAYRALGNRWLGIVWKLWQTGAPYDEAVHVANRSRRGQIAAIA